MQIRSLAVAGVVATLICAPVMFAQALAGERSPAFVDANEVVPDLVVEMRYAGEHNFVGTRIDGYYRRVCLLTKQAAAALAAVQRDLSEQGLVWTSFREFGLKQPDGLEYLALSNLPVGAGLSSSAAIELASALAYLGLTGENPSRETIVTLSRHAENHFVGVPCGILDQGVSGFGEKDHLVFIDCRGPHFETVPMPVGAHFWVFNTHTKRALIDGLYAERHRECTDAARALGVPVLAALTPEQLEQRRALLPEELTRDRVVPIISARVS